MAKTKKDLLPFLKVAAATLDISTRIVVRDRLGRLQSQHVDDLLDIWHRRVFAAGEGTLEVHGLEHVRDAARGPSVPGAPPTRSYVVMTNHQSLLDVPTVIATFPGRIRMVGKRELGEVPVWGHAMKAAGIVFVDRGNRAQSIAALDGAKQQLRDGVSIWIAPEGTRGRTGELQPLKKGGFHLARQLGAPIAPAWITGTREIISPDGFAVVKGGHVVIRYGQPIETDPRLGGVRGEDDIAELMFRVETALQKLKSDADTAALSSASPSSSSSSKSG